MFFFSLCSLCSLCSFCSFFSFSFFSFPSFPFSFFSSLSLLLAPVKVGCVLRHREALTLEVGLGRITTASRGSAGMHIVPKTRPEPNVPDREERNHAPEPHHDAGEDVDRWDLHVACWGHDAHLARHLPDRTRYDGSGAKEQEDEEKGGTRRRTGGMRKRGMGGRGGERQGQGRGRGRGRGEREGGRGRG